MDAAICQRNRSFRLPSSLIDEDRNVGGHVFDYEIEECTVQISQKLNMNLRLPNTQDFFKADLNKHDLAAGIEAAEGNPE